MRIKKTKVLLVEDEAGLLEILANKLKQEGYDVDTAQDGEEGIKKMTQHAPDIVLLDIIMPKVGGFEVLETMHTYKALSKIPVIIISNSGQPVEIERAKALGAKDYLVKAEFDPQEVLQKMEAVLRGGVTGRGDAVDELARTIQESEKGEKNFSKENKDKSGKDEKISSSKSLAGRKILVVEDDQFLRDLIVRKLEDESFEVLQAVDGEEGLRDAKENKPDMVLLDLILPGIDGFEVLRNMKSDKEISDIPIIILSNLGQRDDIEQGLKLGARDYLIKAHFTPGEIVARVKEILSKE